MPRNPRRWTPQEDRILLEECRHLFSEGKKTGTSISRSNVSNAIANRNNKDCRKCWSKLIGLKKDMWAVSEDERLLERVQKYGSQWVLVTKTVETRNSDYPWLDHNEWTSEKDAQLMAAVKCHGTNWKDIKILEFPMRLTTNLKNRHIALLRQSSKMPSVYPNEGEAPEPSMEWLSIEQEMSENFNYGSDEGEYLGSDYNESPFTSTSASSFQNSHTFERSPSVSLTASTIPTSARSGIDHFPQDWELPSRLDPVETASTYYTPIESSFELKFSHKTDIQSTLWKNISDCEPCIPELSAFTMSSPPSQQTNCNTSQTSDGMRFGEASHQESNKLPQSVASDVSSNVPQMVLTVDNPDPQTMTSILEVLTKAKSKATITINS
ncbi:hypothetical protein BJ875DRAFT_440459 [Amylocarpus encephaloides]|uniref:Myb-like domain-containing protein n=1 Tax=Amylocarpus encephaloides TaxID=45428 RepID=A0A9P8C7R6_9HELO|nr:hypothetical protein BJ875DRAFT_440459 [Amylocarpus encephaloides]